MEEEKVKEPTKVFKLVEDEELFYSTGFSMIKRTVKGEEEYIYIPIRSIGIVELQEELRKNEPKPKKKRVFIKKDSKEAKEYGLNHNQWLEILDLADEEYIALRDAWQQESQWKTVIAALDMEFEKKDGTKITDFATKKKIMQSQGITIHQLTQIFKDVVKLTGRMEEEADFLSGKESD